MNGGFYRGKAMAVTMLQVRTPQEYADLAREAEREGADAVGAQLCRIPRELRTKENLAAMFSCTKIPVYVTNYAVDRNEGLAAEEIAADILAAADAGGALLDIPGDLFCTEQYQLTKNARAVEEQRRLIDRIHEKGKEALMSSHILEFRSAEQLLDIAREQERRGADVLKFVTASNSEEELAENLQATALLKKELKKPFVFLSCGKFCREHRLLAPYFGAGFWLCAARHGELDTPEQPLPRELKAFRAAYEPAIGRGV